MREFCDLSCKREPQTNNVCKQMTHRDGKQEKRARRVDFLLTVHESFSLIVFFSLFSVEVNFTFFVRIFFRRFSLFS